MANNHTSLATKYRPQTFDDVCGQETVKHILQYQLDSKTYKQCYLFAGKWGCGKAAPLDADILGPDGYFKMRDAKVGMKVWGEDGNLHNIVGVFPQGVKNMYRITFSDDTYTDCCVDHLWNVRQYDANASKYTEFDTIPASEIYKRFQDGKNMFIPITHPLKFERALPEGDAYRAGVDISSFIEDEYAHLLNVDGSIISTILYSTIADRLNFLRGLLNELNDAELSGTYVVNVPTEEIAESVKFIVQSLGGLVGKYGTQMMPVSLPTLSHSGEEIIEPCGSRCIEDIVKIGDAECQCIMTDNPTGLYLTNDCIVTHNTTSARIFAKTINEGNHDIIEIDAATYNSVDQIRVISEEAKKMPLVGKYKIFIIDECFSGNSKALTSDGYIPIKNVTKGMKVKNILGDSVVTECHEVNVAVDRLCCVTVSGKDIVTTTDHLFLTDRGWIAAKNLKTGDVLCDRKSLQDLWSAIPSELSERLQTNVFQGMLHKASHKEYDAVEEALPKDLSGMWKELSDSDKCQCYNLLRQVWLCLCENEKQGDEILRNMSDTVSMSYKQFKENLQSSMRFDISKSPHIENSSSCQGSYGGVRNLWEEFCIQFESSNLLSTVPKYADIQDATGSSVSRTLEEANAVGQSLKASRSDTENESNESCERYSSYMDRLTWRQWALYQSAVNVIQRTWKRTCTGVCNTDEDTEGPWVSYELQGRPCLSYIETGDRGGWQFPFIEIPAVAGCQESESFGKLRVESVEIYQSGNRHQSKFSCFEDSELDSGFVKMYDLSVSGHPSYIVEDALVHNCHSLSLAANNALLKILEEPPKTAMFILCTTDPQKMLNTVLSRVQRYDFTSIPTDQVVSRLKYIADKESIDIDDASIRYIAKISGGSMRDSISNLDKCASVADHIGLEEVTKALSVVSYHSHLDLLRALIDKDSKIACKIVMDTYEAGKDMKKFISSFMWCVCDVCNSFVFNSYDYINIPELPEYVEKINKMNLGDCLKILEWAKDLNGQIRTEPNPKDAIMVEVMLLTQK